MCSWFVGNKSYSHTIVTFVLGHSVLGTKISNITFWTLPIFTSAIFKDGGRHNTNRACKQRQFKEDQSHALFPIGRHF